MSFFSSPASHASASTATAATPASRRSIAQVVAQYTGRGCVLILEDHSGNRKQYRVVSADGESLCRQSLCISGNAKRADLIDGASLAATQTGIIKAIRAAGFDATDRHATGWRLGIFQPRCRLRPGRSIVFATPHIYYNGSDPNGAANYVSGDIAGCQALGCSRPWTSSGMPIDGFTRNQYGPQVITATIAANQAGKAGAVFWAMDNDNHADGGGQRCF